MIANWKHSPQLAGVLTADAFTDKVVIAFEDGSIAVFEYAFFRKESDFTVVYTEHCGYHAFHSCSVHSIIGTERE